MATLAPNVALLYAKAFTKASRLDQADVAAQLLDDAGKMLWMAAPWSWTLGAAEEITVVAGTQDYTLTVPAEADFLRAEFARRHDGNRSEDLAVEAALPADADFSQAPTKFAMFTSGGSVVARLWPTPPAGITSTVLATYKKKSPQVTEENRGNVGVLTFPDEFWPVYQELVLFKAYQYLQDGRAGGAQVNNQGSVVYTGQLAIAMAALEAYKRGEPRLMDSFGRPEVA